MGHEFTGEIVEVGSSVKMVKVGDKIVSPFTSSWYVHLPKIFVLEGKKLHTRERMEGIGCCERPFFSY